MNKQKLNLFTETFRKNLLWCLDAYPTLYKFKEEDVPLVINRFNVALINGTFNPKGDAMTRTCKELNIKQTRAAIMHWLTDENVPVQKECSK